MCTGKYIHQLAARYVLQVVARLLIIVEEAQLRRFWFSSPVKQNQRSEMSVAQWLSPTPPFQIPNPNPCTLLLSPYPFLPLSGATCVWTHHAWLQVTVWVFINGCTGEETRRHAKNNPTCGILVHRGEGLRGSRGRQYHFCVLLLPGFSADFFCLLNCLSASVFFGHFLFCFWGVIHFHKFCVAKFLTFSKTCHHSVLKRRNILTYQWASKDGLCFHLYGVCPQLEVWPLSAKCDHSSYPCCHIMRTRLKQTALIVPAVALCLIMVGTFGVCLFS